VRACRVLVVDDSPVFLAVASELLAGLPGVEVVGSATSGQAGFELAVRLAPDLVLTDLRMPGFDGLDLAQRLGALPDPPRVVIMTLSDLPAYRTAARAAGASDLLSKEDLASALPSIVRRLLPDCGIGSDENA
jgi:CheY-like chemotaxis protein